MAWLTDIVVLGHALDLMISEIFSSLSDSMILYPILNKQSDFHELLREKKREIKTKLKLVTKWAGNSVIICLLL